MATGRRKERLTQSNTRRSAREGQGGPIDRDHDRPRQLKRSYEFDLLDNRHNDGSNRFDRVEPACEARILAVAVGRAMIRMRMRRFPQAVAKFVRFVAAGGMVVQEMDGRRGKQVACQGKNDRKSPEVDHIPFRSSRMEARRIAFYYAQRTAKRKVGIRPNSENS